MDQQVPILGDAKIVGDQRAGLSIIIPAFDDRLALRRLLSELQLALPPQGSGARASDNLCWEVIVVEGTSAAVTNTEPLAADRELTHQWLHCEASRARQQQLGATAARYSLLWFLHADTSAISAPARWLSKRVADGAAQPNPGFWGRFDVRLDGSQAILKVVATMMNWRSRWSGICTGDQGLFVTAALLAQVGGWPDQPLMEDVELSRQLKKLRRPATPRIALATSARRWQRNGAFRTIWLMWRLRWLYFFGTSASVLQNLYNPDGLEPVGRQQDSGEANGASRAHQ